MINVVDEDFSRDIERKVKSRRDDMKRMSMAYEKVLEYNKWVIPAEGVHTAANDFDVSLLNKVYIGNVRASRNTVLELLSTFGPVSISFLEAKECAFAEFDNPHGALLCMKEVNGMVLEGKTLRAGRTSTFPSSIPKELRSLNKCIVYVSNINEQVEEEQLKDIFNNMGDVEEVRLVYSTSFRHKEYGYIKFKHQQGAKKAISCSNKISLYGRKLKIGSTVINMNMPRKNDFNIPEEVFEIKTRIENAIFGRGNAVVLRNLTEVDDADEDFDLEMEREMRKYGKIVGFRISKEKKVVVYCLYSSNDEARHAFDILHGRFFGGRRIQAEISSEACMNS